jgi:formylglycine-generating enzyme required for sulfatase activity/serine/threonine protein kinase
MTYEELLKRYHFDPKADKLGEGGFGMVFKAYDNTLNRFVAIKACPVKEGGYSLQTEVEMVANLPDHSNIAKYEPISYRCTVGFSESEFAIMQFYPDGNLVQYVEAHRPQGEVLKNIVMGILSGIAFLHSKDGKPVLIHRDLKPSNILMIRRPDGEPVPKIADFGLAKTSASGKSLSNSGGAFTAQYMSPEQATFDKLDWRTDLWSFGSILYFICTGEHAFTAPEKSDGEASTGIISQQIREGKLPNIDHIAEPYRDMIAACWQRDRTERVQSATALLAMLDPNVAREAKKEPKQQPKAAPPKTFDIRAALAEVERLFKAQNYAAALTKCKAALAEVPQHPRLQALQEEIKNAIAKAEATFDVRAAIAEIEGLLKTKNYDTALTKCKAALAEVPQHPRLEALKAEIIEAKKSKRPPTAKSKPQPENPPTPTKKLPYLWIGAGVLALVIALVLLLSKGTPTPNPILPKLDDTIATITDTTPIKAPEDATLAAEKAAWEKAKASKDIDQLNTFLQTYPDGVYANVATQLLNSLTEAQADADANTKAQADAEAQRKAQADAEAKRKAAEAATSRSSDPFAGQMKYLSGGSFSMGSNENSNEKPIHTVTVSGFSISKYEVTQKQWRDIMGTSPSYFKNCDNCPVEQVSWNDIQDFLRKLNAQTGKRYRLPTEAEWEYAARGGQSYTYAGSDNIGGVAWYGSNSGSKTHPVGQKSANGYGLYDMTGNVWEWCSDWYGSDYYSSSPSSNPKGPSSGANRVLRGGSWNFNAEYCRTANRDTDTPTYRDSSFGFRLVLP